MKRVVVICFCFILSACGYSDYKYYLNIHSIEPPEQNNFTHCFNYGCQTQKNIALPQATSNRLHQLFKTPAASAHDERIKISQAIQIFETDIGALTGTKNDKRGTFRLYQDDADSTKSFQQDCVDESTNTTIYLALLENMGLLKFHKPVFPANRQPLLHGARWWHQTAVIEDIATNENFAVDSWFFDNGQPAAIVPLKIWKKGWQPLKKKK